MAQTLAELLVKLGVDAGSYYRELDKTKRAANQLSRDFNNLAKQAAAAFTVYQVLDGVRQQVSALDQLDEMAQKTGASVEALSRLKYAADLEGVEDFSAAMIKLQQAIIGGQNAGSEQAKAFKALGISVRDASGQLKSSDAVMAEVADRFSRLPDGATKSAIALALFGKSGAQLIPLLNNGADGLKRYADEADRFGITVTEQASKAAAQLSDDMFRLNAMIDGATRTITIGMIPSMNDLIGTLTDPQTIENAQALANGIVTAFNGAATAISYTVGMAKWAAESLAALSAGANDPVRIADRIDEIDARMKRLIDTAAEGAGPVDKLMASIGESVQSAQDRSASGAAYTFEHELDFLVKERAMLIERKRILDEMAAAPRPLPPAAPEKPKDLIKLTDFGNDDAIAKARKSLDDLDRAREEALKVAMGHEEASRNAVASFLDDLRTQEEAAFATFTAIRDHIIATTRQGSAEREALLVSAEQRLTDELAGIQTKRIADQQREQAEATRAAREQKEATDRALRNDPLAVFAGIDTAEELQRLQEPMGMLNQAMLDFASLSSDALSSANQRFGDLIANAVLFGESGSSAAKAMGRALVTDVVSGMVQIGSQMLAQKALGSLLRIQWTEEAVAANATIAASAAPAAAATSLATAGTNAPAALAGMAAAAAAAIGLFTVAGGRELGGGVSPGSAYDFNEQDTPEVYRRRSDGRMFLFPGASGGDVIPGQSMAGGGEPQWVFAVNNNGVEPFELRVRRVVGNVITADAIPAIEARAAARTQADLLQQAGTYSSPLNRRLRAGRRMEV